MAGKYRPLDDRGRQAANVRHQGVGLALEQPRERRVGTIAITRRVTAGLERPIVGKARKVLQDSAEQAMGLGLLNQVTDTLRR